jgi:hypothetical protein
LFLGGKKTPSEAFSQAHKPEAADIAAGSLSRVWKTMARIFWRNSPFTGAKTLLTAYVLTLWEPATL